MKKLCIHNERLKVIPTRSETRQDISFAISILVLVLAVIARAIRQENKGILIGKEVKLSLFTDDLILYLELPKDYTQNC